MKISLLVCSAVIGMGAAFQASGAEFPAEVKKWLLVERPSAIDDSASQALFDKANHSKYEWEVAAVADGVTVRPQGEPDAEKGPRPDFDTTVQLEDSKASASQMLKVEDGWIAAYNRGEFGAAIYWFSEDGLSRKMLSGDQVNEFMLEGDRIFAVQGLAHLSLSRGSMIEIKKEAAGWAVSQFIRLPESAEAIARIGAGDYVIVTTGMLLRVNLQKEVLILATNTNWGSLLYPNSVAVDSDYIYVGMREFVARCPIGKSVQTIDLLVPTAKWLDGLDGKGK